MRLDRILACIFPRNVSCACGTLSQREKDFQLSKPTFCIDNVSGWAGVGPSYEFNKRNKLVDVMQLPDIFNDYYIICGIKHVCYGNIF